MALPIQKDYGRRCKLVLVSDQPVKSCPILKITDVIRDACVQGTIYVYSGQVTNKNTESDFLFREVNGTGQLFISYLRVKEGQLDVLWEEDWGIYRGATTNSTSIYCTCGGPAKICDTGYSKYTICSKCKKEKQVFKV